nr:signal transducing adapter molecule 1 [Helicoverpa armigera]
MGIFGNSSPFDQDVERATSENNTSEEWGLIMEICDRAGASAQSAKECLRAVMRRLAHPDPHVQVHAATLLDACVANCGRAFHLEVASRDFETEFRRLVARAQPAVAARLRALLRKWAEGEFRDDPQLDLIPSLHAKLRDAGERAEPAPAPAAAPAAAQREQEELARAIALSLRESSAAPAPAPLYPRVDADAPPPRKVRALYDFEAAEDNELTFLAGEIVHVTDSSDPNWWKGYNERGEGLFPANFVTGELSAPAPPAEAPAAAAEEPAPLRIDEATMDAALALLHEADPRAAGAEEAALARLEAAAHGMGALVDAALERADRRHARLTQLSADLVDALNLYHELMRAPPLLLAPLHPPPPRC